MNEDASELGMQVIYRLAYDSKDNQDRLRKAGVCDGACMAYLCVWGIFIYYNT